MPSELITPKGVSLFITHSCNLSCPFCFYRSFQKSDRADLSLDEWFQLIDELARMKVLQVRIYGGEPLMRDDLPQLIERIVERRMRFSMISNGTLMTPEFAEFLAGTRRCGSVQISVDGPEREHDRIRGEGMHRKALDALEMLKQAGIRRHVNMVASASNFQVISGAARSLIEEAGVEKLRVNMVSDYPDSPLPSSDRRLTEEEVAWLIGDLLPLFREYPSETGSSLPWKLYQSMVSPVRPSESSPFCRCSELYLHLTVRADGAVLTCPSSEYNVLGRVNRDSLEEIWHRNPTLLQFRREVEKGRVLTGDECRDCPYTWYCAQSCPARRESRRYCRKRIAKLLGIDVENAGS